MQICDFTIRTTLKRKKRVLLQRIIKKCKLKQLKPPRAQISDHVLKFDD